MSNSSPTGTSLRYAVRSDRGLVRGNNEDSVYAGPRLLAVADGMGGHAAGEVASKIVITAMERLDEDRPPGDLLATLRAAVLDANRGIADAIERDARLDGMGTTLTAMRFFGGHVGLAHVGDSRAYLLRGERLTQITHDDTYVQSLVDAGQLTPDQAAHHPRKSVILRALMGGDVEPDVSIRETRRGDRYLLCSDGLSDVVTAETIAAALGEGDPQFAADRLVELALRGGGPDNVTVIVADVVEGGHGDDLPVIAGAFVDPTAPTEASDASPAERAARMTEDQAAPPTRPARRRRRWWRRSLAIAVVLVVVIGGGAGFYSWTQTQYFVGRDGEEVAIFQGVNSAFGPVKFYNVAENSDIRLTDLTPAARNTVVAGITAHSLDGARQVIAHLRDQLLPLCPTSTVEPTPTPPLTVPTAVESSLSAPTTTAPPTTAGKPSGQRTTATSAPGKRGSTTPHPTPPAQSSPPAASQTDTSASTPPPTRQLTPGVDCRTP
ncbi:MAG: protein phosphatase 2C domain-containing protein [Actinomycetia bacterium]|nr:protein phosphatase 2C domain-containing protein [Actinomycetes bacterium]